MIKSENNSDKKDDASIYVERELIDLTDIDNVFDREEEAREWVFSEGAMSNENLARLFGEITSYMRSLNNEDLKNVEAVLNVYIKDVWAEIMDGRGLTSEEENVSGEAARAARKAKGVRIKPNAKYLDLIGGDEKDAASYSCFNYDEAYRNADMWEELAYDAGLNILEFAYSVLTKYLEFVDRYLVDGGSEKEINDRLRNVVDNMAEAIQSEHGTEDETADDNDGSIDDKRAKEDKRSREYYAKAFRELGEIGLDLWW